METCKRPVIQEASSNVTSYSAKAPTALWLVQKVQAAQMFTEPVCAVAASHGAPHAAGAR
jgi:hypothetical protein